MASFHQKTQHYLQNGVPFVFLINFDATRQEVYTFSEAADQGIIFNINGIANETRHHTSEGVTGPVEVHPEPISKEAYAQAFETVKRHLLMGNSFLLNLTFPSVLDREYNLSAVYECARAPYKLLYRDEFLVFSPECYFKFEDGMVYTYPMKGTIRNEGPHSVRALLDNPKEQYEHNTIVDLLRNDLSIMAKQVEVTRFRYVEKIRKGHEEWLQTSSEIRGKLPDNWKERFAELLLKSLPAGSVSGAPKAKTVEIIRQVEGAGRGFYTGVFGVFDGRSIDSGVMIRYMENRGGRTYFRSGGGITHLSQMEAEYQELIDKIYVPSF